MKKTVVKIVYKGLNNIGAPIYNNMFEYNVPNRELRSSDQYLANVPKTRPNLVNITWHIGAHFIGIIHLYISKPALALINLSWH